MTKVFVYGTLRADPIGKLVKLNDCINGLVIDLGSYPALVTLDTELIVEGDVYEVNDETMELLDKYEGVDQRMYHRSSTTTLGGHDVTVYMFSRIVSSWCYYKGYPHVTYQGVANEQRNISE